MKIRIVSALALMSTVLLVSSCTRHANISLADIQRDIVGRNTGEGLMSWTFVREEPREISIIESKFNGDAAIVIVDVTTEDVDGMFGKMKMAGKLRLHYEWIGGEWNLVRVENLTFKEVE